MILILVGLFSLIFVGGFLLILSLVGIRQRVRLENGYDSYLLIIASKSVSNSESYPFSKRTR